MFGLTLSRAMATMPHVHASIHEAGLVLLHIPSGRIFQSNRIGARIWEGIAAGKNPDRIAGEISREYGLSEGIVRQHTSSFVAALEHEGFITTPGFQP
jgi:hypothetical protein